MMNSASYPRRSSLQGGHVREFDISRKWPVREMGKPQLGQYAAESENAREFQCLGSGHSELSFVVFVSNGLVR